MKVLLYSFLSASILLFYQPPLKEKFSINLKLRQSDESNAVVVIVEVKNISDSPLRISGNTMWDYKWAYPYYMGNYIVEIQKNEKDTFQLFPPTGFPDPVYSEEAWIKLYPNEVLVDSMDISFYYPRHKFPEGDYRVRVAFNADRWSHSFESPSNWIYFTIPPDDSKY